MAELDQNQTDAGTEATPTPLDTILDTPAADVPAQDQEAELGGIDAPHVPLKALKKERERRQKADRQVEELRRSCSTSLGCGFSSTRVSRRRSPG